MKNYPRGRQSLASQKRFLFNLIDAMHTDLKEPSTKPERIKLYGCLIDAQKTIHDIKKTEISRTIEARLKKLGVKKA